MLGCAFSLSIHRSAGQVALTHPSLPTPSSDPNVGEIPGIGPTRHIYTSPDGKRMEIREVWVENLDLEMAAIREVGGKGGREGRRDG